MPKSFLVVGGSSDIGLLLCDLLLDKGYTLTVVARDATRVESIKSRGANVIVGDALESEVISSAITKTLELGEGSITGVAHLVGSIMLRPPHALKLEAFEDVIQTNLISAFLTLSLTGKAMLKTGSGRMVFTSSVAGSLGLVNHEAIAAAKGGIESMVRSAAATYSKRGIRVNAVAPGLTDTRLASTILRSDAIREASEKMIPLNRINQPKEIAECIFWLLTGAPDNYTGQIMHLDGGMSQIRG